MALIVVDREFLDGLLQGAAERRGHELAEVARRRWYTPLGWEACLKQEVASRADCKGAVEHFFSQARARHNECKREEKIRSASRRQPSKPKEDTPLFNA